MNFPTPSSPRHPSRPLQPYPSPHVSSRRSIGVSQAESIRTLNLHGNRIIRCDDLDRFTSLTTLNLSSNLLASLEGLPSLPHLAHLHASSNRLTHLRGLPVLPALLSLRLAFNRLTNLEGLEADRLPVLEHLDVRGNNLGSLAVLSHFARLPHLKELRLLGGPRPNPVVEVPGLFQAVVASCPLLEILDEHATTAPPPTNYGSADTAFGTGTDHRHRDERDSDDYTDDQAGATEGRRMSGSGATSSVSRAHGGGESLARPRRQAALVTTSRPRPGAVEQRLADLEERLESLDGENDEHGRTRRPSTSSRRSRARGAPGSSFHRASSAPRVSRQDVAASAQLPTPTEDELRTALQDAQSQYTLALAEAEARRRAEVDDLRDEVQRLAKEVRRRAAALEGIGADADAAVHAAVDKARARVAAAEEKVTLAHKNAENAVLEAHAERDAALAVLNQARVELATERTQGAALSDKVQALTARLSDVESTRDRVSEQLQSTQLQVAEEIRQRREETARAEKETMHKVRLTDQVEHLIKDVERARLSEDSFRDQIKTMVVKQDKLQLEVTRMEKEVEAARAAEREASWQARHVAGALEALQAERAQASEWMHKVHAGELRAETERSAAQAAAFAQERSKWAVEKERWAAEKETWEGKLAAQALRVTELEQELRVSLKERQHDVGLLQEALTKAETEHAALRAGAAREAERRKAQQNVVSDLTASLDQVRSRYRQLQDTNAALLRQVEESAPEEAARLRAEVVKWRQACQALPGIQEEVALLTQAKSRAEDRARQAEEALSKRERALLVELAGAKEGHLRAQAELERQKEQRSGLEDVIAVKSAMVDSAQKQVSDLKQALKAERDARAEEIKTWEAEWAGRSKDEK